MILFQPTIPLSGLAGWAFLQRTRDAQQDMMMRSSVAERETSHFRAQIGRISSAADLVADRQLLSVALGAFGLSEDMPNRFFIQKVLESDPRDAQALAAKLADSRYGALADAFGFASPEGPRTLQPDFAERIISAYEDRAFEAAVGEVNPDLRLALGLQREMKEIIGRVSGSDARWYSVLGTPPLRAVFEGAFGFPDSIGALDIDRQVTEFKKASKSALGTDDLGAIAESGTLEVLRRRFILTASNETQPVTSTALSLLRGSSGNNILETLYFGAV